MDNSKSFQVLLDQTELMISTGQTCEQVTAMVAARMQYDAALAVLKTLAAYTAMASQKVDILLERVHGLLASICDRSREYEQAVRHWEEQLALHGKVFGDRAHGLVDIYVSLSNIYLERLNKVAEAKAAAEKAFEILSENSCEVSASAIKVNFHLGLCELRTGNKAAAAVAFERALAMLDANPSLVTPIEDIVIRKHARELA